MGKRRPRPWIHISGTIKINALSSRQEEEMAMNDLNIVHGVIVRPEGCFQGNIEIRGGKIIRVCPDQEPVNPARDTVDASGLLVFPGLIDSHVHIRGGRFSYREDFASGTMAAAAGGVTTIVEMPVALPPASRKEDFVVTVAVGALSSSSPRPGVMTLNFKIKKRKEK